MADKQFWVEWPNGNRTRHEVPTDMGLSLMEALKALDYPIEATCGGMALCATCRIEWIEGNAPAPEAAELDMLDTLPDTGICSRLSCQLRLTDISDGCAFQLQTLRFNADADSNVNIL
jgi:2Fe-2S ferredoxin